MKTNPLERLKQVQQLTVRDEKNIATNKSSKLVFYDYECGEK